jgi:hypothetical protein
MKRFLLSQTPDEQQDEHPLSLLFLCGVLLSVLASIFTPAISVPISGNISAQPQPTSRYVTVSSIDPTMLSIGDTKAGDNWASTWADDDQLYTYISDGTGFGLASAMSMYPAKIVGTPAHSNLSGQNISTNAIGKGTGGGPSGKKVSGLISVSDPTSPSGHVLYAWVRNITRNGGASLMYSYDHAATWNWAWGNPDTTSGAIIPELGYPTWMQAGKNDTAAQDMYLYFYSQDTPTAYQVADAVIMGRIMKTQAKVKSAYQYFAGLDNNGNPLWTTHISLRKPLFTARGQSYRTFVTYDPPLKRYFLLTANGDGLDSNWQTGHPTHNLGIYEAVRPWGPWYTAYYNDHFQPNMNVFAPQMVAKWISADGMSFYLLYSSQPVGPYRFNLQKVQLSSPGADLTFLH